MRVCYKGVFKYGKCGASQTCVNGYCESSVKECENSEPATCDGPRVKKCLNGYYQVQSCGADLCLNGKCVKCISGETPDSCDGQMLKKCVNNTYVTESCPVKMTCFGGKCVDMMSTPSCDVNEVEVCDGNNIKY